MNDFMKLYEQLQGEWRKRVKPHKCLGLALSEDSLVAAELHRRKDGFSPGRKDRFAFPEDATFDRPRQLGEALRLFLKESGFVARKVAVGIPAKWVMTREVTLPPSSGSAVSGALKIHAEREFSLSPEDLVLDYTGVIHPDRPSRLVLCAMLKKRMRQIQDVVEGAGLELLSISVASAALLSLGGGVDSGARARFALFMGPAHVELLARVGEETVDVKYFQRRAESAPGAFLNEMGRALSAYMKSVPDGAEEKMLLWSETGDLKENATDIVGALPPGMTARYLPVEGILEGFGVSAGAEEIGPFGPSLALALSVFGERAPSVADFLNSRMEAKTGRIEKRHVRMAAMVAGAALVILAGMIVSWKMNVNEVAGLKETLAGMQADIDSAREVVGKVSDAGGWYGLRPRVLDCLRELTLVFPEEGRVWTTSLALNEEMSGIISGKANDEEGVIEVMDKMKKNGAFSNVQMIYMRDGGKESQEVSFSMSFVFMSG